MRFQQTPPPPALSRWVRCFWHVESGGDGSGIRSFNTMADGFPGLMVRLSGGSAIRDSEHGLMPDAFIYGQATVWRRLGAEGRLNALGIFFQPHALRTVFGLDAPEVTDACMDLAATAGERSRHLCAELGRTEDPVACMELLSRFIAERTVANAALADALIEEAATTILDRKGDVDLSDLYVAASISERTFERRFKRVVGLSPRLFARIRRFQHTLERMRTGDYDKLSDVAYAADYADQSHYIRAFKEFTGISPLEFKRDGDEVVENLVELPRRG